MASVVLDMNGARPRTPETPTKRANICGLSVTRICYFSCVGTTALAVAFFAKGALLPPEVSAGWYYAAGTAFTAVAVETGVLGKWFAPLLGIQQIENNLRVRNQELEAQNGALKTAVLELKELLTKSGTLLGQMSQTGTRLENVGDTLAISAQTLDDVDDNIADGVNELREMIAREIVRVDEQKQALQGAKQTLETQVHGLQSEVLRLGSVTTSLNVSASQLIQITRDNGALLTQNTQLLQQLNDVKTQLVRVQEIFMSQDAARQKLLEQDEATNTETATILGGLRGELQELHRLVGQMGKTTGHAT